MKKILSLSVIFTIGIILSGCPKPCVEPNYLFAADAQITPDNDSIHIGDTLYLISDVPNQLIDQQTGTLVNYSNSTGVASSLSITSSPVSDGAHVIDAVVDFNFISIEGRIYNDKRIPRPDGIQQLEYAEINGNYVLKVGLIAKKKGNYILGISNGVSNGRKKTNNCEKASFNIKFDNTAQHFYLAKQWYSDAIDYGYGAQRVYYFKVY